MKFKACEKCGILIQDFRSKRFCLPCSDEIHEARQKGYNLGHKQNLNARIAQLRFQINRESSMERRERLQKTLNRLTNPTANYFCKGEL